MVRDLKEIFVFLAQVPRIMGMQNMPTEKVNILQDIRHIIHEWKDYKELEEQGKLLKLPCAYGETVYVIPTRENALLKITKMKCLGFSIGKPTNTANLFPINKHDSAVKIYQPDFTNFGKTVFLTCEKAESALKELEAKEV